MRKRYYCSILTIFSLLFWSGMATATHDDMRIRGIITELVDDAIIVNGEEYALSNETEYEDQNENSVDQSFFTTGMFVKVDYIVSNFSRIALKIELVDPENDSIDADDEYGNDDDLLLIGLIESITPTLLIVGGKDLVLTEQTQYEDENDALITNEDFFIGMFVKVEYFHADTARVASKVEIETDVLSLGDAERERGRTRESSRYTKIDDSSLDVFRGRTTWRAKVRKNKAQGRLKSRLHVQIPAAAPDFPDTESARNATLTLTLLRDNQSYAVCFYEFVQSRPKQDGLWAQFRIDGRFKSRPNNTSRLRFKSGNCDTDLLTPGIQSDVPAIQSGDTFVIGDIVGDYLHGTL